ncbi:Bordetella uptake gene [Rhabdaerophilaceae bacterium]
MDRRLFVAGLCGSALALPSLSPARAQTAATRIIYPFAAGGGGDTICRLIAEEIRKPLARQVIVENRTGADGLIAIRAVKNAAPDGTTILVTTGPTMYLLPMVEHSPSFDAMKDFVPVSLLGRFEFGIIVGAAVPAKTFPELVAWLKANPDRRSFGVPSNGTLPHFMGTVIEKALGFTLTRVPYRGGALVVNDVVGGHLPFGIITTADGFAQHKAGNLRIIAVGSDTRSPDLPDVGTLREAGIDLVADAYFSMWLPAGTPAQIASAISNATMAAVAQPSVAEKFRALSVIPVGSDPAALVKEFERNVAFWKPVVESTGYKISG